MGIPTGVCPLTPVVPMLRPWTVPFALQAACAPPGLVDSGTGPGVVFAAGAIGWVQASSEISTVATVHWRTPGPSQGRLWVREAGTAEWTAALHEQAPVEEHSGVLRGMAAETDYEILIEPDEDGAAPSLELGLRTGVLPDWLPVMVSSAEELGASLGYFAVPLVLAESSTSVGAILDWDGQPVWYGDHPGQVTRVRVTPDHQGLVLLRNAATIGATGSLEWLSWDGVRLRERIVEGLHTDFTFLPDGRVAALGREVRELAPGRPFLGDTIVQFDPDGGQEVIWSVLDALPPDLAELYPPCPEAIGAECYSHVNSVAYDAEEDAFVMTAAYLQTAMLVDRASGEVRWALGGPLATLTVPGSSKPFGYPHSAQIVLGGVLVFDDRSPFFEGGSGALEFALDLPACTATPGWSYVPEEHVVNQFLGNAERLSDGRTLVVVPDLGALDLVDADGRLERRISTEQGLPVRFGQAIGSLYP